MTADLAGTPTSGLRVQLCGDAHLSNFGAYASPERRLVFDLNDFDETLPGPFEWDVKRLAASVAVAGRVNGYSAKQRRRTVMGVGSAYREAMRAFAKMPMLEVWYSHADVETELLKVKDLLDSDRYRFAKSALAKAHSQTSMRALNKLTTMVDGARRIVSEPPLIVPAEDLFTDRTTEALYEFLRAQLRRYRRTLQPDRRHLLEQFQLVHVARKVVGVGSVGTRAWIILMDGGDGADPLFLQAKEAQRSVLEGFVDRCRHTNQGERVVAGQHLMQAFSDIFLGWDRARGADDVERDFYIRQLRDWKFSMPVDQMLPVGMGAYARLCGWTLARAHARSGDRMAIAAYLGKSDAFDNAIANFAETYAEQNERDHAALVAAVQGGRVAATTGV